MSKINHKKISFKSLDINKEIDEEIGKLKNNGVYYNYTYIHNNKRTETKYNLKLNHKEKNNSCQSISLDKNYQKPQNKKNYIINSDISYNNNTTKDKKHSNIFKSKANNKKNLKQVERVFIDLMNTDETETMKSESIITGNTYENDNTNKTISNSKSCDKARNQDLYDIYIILNKVKNRWKKNCTNIKETDISILSNEISRKKREIEIILNRWKDNENVKNGEKISFFINNSNNNNKGNDSGINYKKCDNNQITEEINICYLIDRTQMKEKKKENQNNNDITINNKENKNIFQEIKEGSFSLIADNLKIKEKEYKNIINRWNKDNKSIQGEYMIFAFENLKPRLSPRKNQRRKSILWEENFQTENKISFYFEGKKHDDNNSHIFKYSEKQYINDLIKGLHLTENNINNNNFFILNLNQINNENNINNINSKAIKANSINELEVEINNFYNEYKNKNTINKNLNEISSNINPIFIINEEQIKKLYLECYNDKSKNELKAETNYFSKAISFGNEEQKSFGSKKDMDISGIDNSKRTFEDFGQSTPLSMLDEKFYVYAVSRTNKYSIKSSQSNISLLRKYSNSIGYKTIFSFDMNNLNINHFSLWIEKLERTDSTKSDELESIKEI